jgi:hypothetical protein
MRASFPVLACLLSCARGHAMRTWSCHAHVIYATGGWGAGRPCRSPHVCHVLLANVMTCVHAPLQAVRELQSHNGRDQRHQQLPNGNQPGPFRILGAPLAVHAVAHQPLEDHVVALGLLHQPDQQRCETVAHAGRVHLLFSASALWGRAHPKLMPQSRSCEHGGSATTNHRQLPLLSQWHEPLGCFKRLTRWYMTREKQPITVA